MSRTRPRSRTMRRWLLRDRAATCSPPRRRGRAPPCRAVGRRHRAAAELGLFPRQAGAGAADRGDRRSRTPSCAQRSSSSSWAASPTFGIRRRGPSVDRAVQPMASRTWPRRWPMWRSAHRSTARSRSPARARAARRVRRHVARRADDPRPVAWSRKPPISAWRSTMLADPRRRRADHADALRRWLARPRGPR